MWRASVLFGAAIMLAGCAAGPVGSGESPWAIDSQVDYCASTRVEGFVLGDPGALRQIPFVGPVASGAQGAIEAESVCRVVRTFTPEAVTQIKDAQLEAARSGQPLMQSGISVTPRPVSEACVALASTHQSSGMPLRSQLVCRDNRGVWRPAAL